MLVFAHIGITLGVALAGNAICRRLNEHSREIKEGEPPPQMLRRAVPSSSMTTEERTASSMDTRPSIWRGLFDLRFWIIGSILPDVIDKPISHFLFSSTFHGNGRIFSHTLLFFIILLVAGLCLGIIKKKLWLLALSGGVLMHLILDSMWRTPQTMLWPLQGWNFPRDIEAGWLVWVQSMWHGLLNYAGVFVPEIMGAIIIAVFLWIVIRRKQISTVFRSGYL